MASRDEPERPGAIMFYPSPVHHVTPHNQGQPRNLHPLTEQADTVESHFGVYIIQSNTNYIASPSKRYGETEQADVDPRKNSTNAYPAQPTRAASRKFQTIHQIAADAGATAQLMSREDIGGQK